MKALKIIGILALVLFWSGVVLIGVVGYSIGTPVSLPEGDPEEARALAEKGDAVAQMKFGIHLYYGTFMERDAKESVKWLRKAAAQRNAEAQYTLGFFYDEGEELPQDDRQAAEWYRKAALQGHGRAQWQLGEFYKNGRGVKKDLAESCFWYSLAASSGEFVRVVDRWFAESHLDEEQLDEVKRRVEEWKPARSGKKRRAD
jgi:hypothetical protein